MTEAQANKELVRTAFGPWESGDSGPFFDLIADDVSWTVIGSTPGSGTFESKQALIEGAFGPLQARLVGPLTTRFIEIVAEGERVFLRFESSGRGANGLAYEQVYCWAMTMRGGRIVEITAYLDTDLLARALA